jgi:hypothetical protein
MAIALAVVLARPAAPPVEKRPKTGYSAGGRKKTDTEGRKDRADATPLGLILTQLRSRGDRRSGS